MGGVVGGLGGFRFFAVAVLDVVATPVGEGGPTPPLWGGVVTLGSIVFWCVGVGYGGLFGMWCMVG